MIGIPTRQLKMLPPTSQTDVNAESSETFFGNVDSSGFFLQFTAMLESERIDQIVALELVSTHFVNASSLKWRHKSVLETS